MTLNRLSKHYFVFIYFLELLGLLLCFSNELIWFIGLFLWLLIVALKFKQFKVATVSNNSFEFFIGITITFSLCLWPLVSKLSSAVINPSESYNFVILIYLIGKSLELIFYPTLFLNFSKKFNYPTLNISSIPDYILHSSSILFIVLSIASWKLGISLMGEAPRVILPFKLNGILNLTRIYIIPLAFIYFLNFYLSSKSFKKIAILLFYIFIFSVTESFARTSRGVFFYNFILLSLCFIHYLKSINFKAIIACLLFILSSLFLYIFISSVRIYNIDKQYTTFQNSWNYSLDRVLRTKFIYDGSTRLFGGGKEINSFSSHVDPFFGDFDKIKKLGGAAQYHTKIIDKAESIFHNSGVTFFGEIFLYFGIFGILISFATLRLFLASLQPIIVDNKMFITFMNYYLFIIFNSGLGFFNLISFNLNHFLTIITSLVLVSFVKVEQK